LTTHIKEAKEFIMTKFVTLVLLTSSALSAFIGHADLSHCNAPHELSQSNLVSQRVTLQSEELTKVEVNRKNDLANEESSSQLHDCHLGHCSFIVRNFITEFAQSKCSDSQILVARLDPYLSFKSELVKPPLI
jgi:hypothetical protein